VEFTIKGTTYTSQREASLQLLQLNIAFLPQNFFGKSPEVGSNAKVCEIQNNTKPP